MVMLQERVVLQHVSRASGSLSMLHAIAMCTIAFPSYETIPLVLVQAAGRDVGALCGGQAVA